MTKQESAPLKVPSEDPPVEEDLEPRKDETNVVQAANDGGKLLKEGELTPEDEVLKAKLDAAVARLLENANSTNGNQEIVSQALGTLKFEVQTATSSLTSVPKPLKFLSSHVASLRECYEKVKSIWGEKHSLKLLFADLLSVLSMTVVVEEKSRECLKLKLEGNISDLGDWGHEYVRAITGEIGVEYNERVVAAAKAGQSITNIQQDDLLSLIGIIAPFQVKHNSEVEAVDLLIETNHLDWLSNPEKHLVDEHNFARVALYLIRYADFLVDMEELSAVLIVVYDIFIQQKEFTDALRIAIRLGDMKRIRNAMKLASKYDQLVLKQMALILGSHRMFSYITVLEESADDAEEELEAIKDLKPLIQNTNMWERFLTVARELNVEEAKTPEDVYKSHLSETGGITRGADAALVESARANLASTYVNCFVNCGFEKDLLMTKEETSNTWLFKNKDHGMTAAVASIGLILLWNIDEGMMQIDRYLYSENEYVKAGALLAFGVVNSGVRDESDPASAILLSYLDSSKPVTDWTKICAALGLGIAYAGAPTQDIADALTSVVQESGPNAGMEVASIAGLGLGLSFAGTANDDVATTLLQRLMESTPAELDQAISRHLALSLAFLFLGKQEGADAMIEALRTIDHPVGKFAVVMVEACAYAATGNVLKVQNMLHICAEHPNNEDETKPKDATATSGSSSSSSSTGALNAAASAASAGAAVPMSTTNEDEDDSETSEDAIKEKASAQARQLSYQSAAVIGLALITMNESVGRQMVERTYQHLLLYGDLSVRRAVPLAIGLSHVSDPNYDTIDVLSKLTHDSDLDTAMNAIFALGIVGAGTNNSRIAGLLRQLSTFYNKDPNPLFIVRMAQSLLHAGKGLVTLSPLHSDRTLILNSSLAGLLAVILCGIDFSATILSKFHILMFCIAPALRLRMIMTVDENLEPLPVNVRVGLAVDTVAMAGQPKTITGFQTHMTPALLSFADRCELGDPEKWKSLTNVLEGVVILKRNKLPE